METFAIGELGLSPRQFWGMTIAEYKRRVHGFNEKWKREDMNRWQHDRAVAFAFYRTMGGKEKLDAFWPLQTEEKSKSLQASAEWAQKNLAKIKATYNNGSTRVTS